MTARILDPLHLTGTWVPEGASAMPTPYLHGYLTNDQGVTVDVSAAGGDPSSMISTTGDLDRFITAIGVVSVGVTDVAAEAGVATVNRLAVEAFSS